MDFGISEAFEATLARVRTFVKTELYPLEAAYQARGFRALEPVLAEKRAQVKAMGLWLPQIEKEHGGLGLSLMEHGLVCAELAKSPFGFYAFNCQAPDSGNMEILIKYGTKEQQERWLKPLLAGETRSCFSMTEPEFPGSNPAWMGTTAEKDGSDYIINGHKWFTTSYEGAAFAIVMAITDPGAPKYMRASQIIVPVGTPGFELVENISCMGHRGDAWDSHAEVRYTNVRVPQANLLGPEGAGFVIAQDRLGPGRIHHCMRWLGISERAFDLMCTYALAREVAPDRPLAGMEFVQGWIAESRAEINAAKLAVLHAAWVIDTQGAKAAREEISLIKFSVAKILHSVVDRAIQAHGGLGITDRTPLASFYRNERAGRIYDGPDEVHKISAAKQILKRYQEEAAAAMVNA
ncbi:MAG: acyl-CoA dehydrogenase family protein [Candidatus Hydrogenedentes bacterium]|nr:acyl-CoA dehydrogenase family protein [Candidatus Hydrogenedentota bacterium]